MAETLYAIHVFATFFMTGLIWTMQIVHYPLYADVGAGQFKEFERKHIRSIFWVVTPVMTVEMATAVGLALFQPALGPELSPITSWLMGAGPFINLVGLALIWASTALFQAPAHQRLSGGFDADIHRRLVRGNWIRTILWTMRSILLVWMFFGMV